VGVSACLLGFKCRYNAQDKKDEALLKELKGCEIIPFCPEDAILGTPRETIDLIEERAIGNESGTDYSDAIKKEAQKFIKNNPNLDAVYVKAKSPSCALYSAKNYDKNRNLLSSTATGLFTKELLKKYSNIKERK